MIHRRTMYLARIEPPGPIRVYPIDAIEVDTGDHNKERAIIRTRKPKAWAVKGRTSLRGPGFAAIDDSPELAIAAVRRLMRRVVPA